VKEVKEVKEVKDVSKEGSWFDGEPDVTLVPGTVRGLRTWALVDEPPLDAAHPLVIVGQAGFKWQPGENVAACNLRSLGADAVKKAASHRPAGKSCSCGFYGYWAGTGLDWHAGLTGVIEAYGLTQLGTRGFRCERARVLALAPSVSPMSPLEEAAHRWLFSCRSESCRWRLTRTRLTQLSERYGVPVLKSQREMLRAFPPTALSDLTELLGVRVCVRPVS
jgi:hypothetical protein